MVGAGGAARLAGGGGAALGRGRRRCAWPGCRPPRNHGVFGPTADSIARPPHSSERGPERKPPERGRVERRGPVLLGPVAQAASSWRPAERWLRRAGRGRRAAGGDPRRSGSGLSASCSSGAGPGRWSLDGAGRPRRAAPSTHARRPQSWPVGRRHHALWPPRSALREASAQSQLVGRSHHALWPPRSALREASAAVTEGLPVGLGSHPSRPASPDRPSSMPRTRAGAPRPHAGAGIWSSAVLR